MEPARPMARKAKKAVVIDRQEQLRKVYNRKNSQEFYYVKKT
jgi:hypothetical protein